MKKIYHWYHIYVDGNWHPRLIEHLWALRHYKLYENLTEMFVGFVGLEGRIADAKRYLTDSGIKFTTCAESHSGWEQVTQIPMWEFSQNNDGFCVYAHTKGAANPSDLSDNWRRAMTWYTICEWESAIESLESGKRAAGCHWIATGSSGHEHSSHNHPPVSTGFFGGTFWWTRLEELRAGYAPTLESRYCAEHWIGQRVPPLLPEHIEVLGGQHLPIGSYPPEVTDWHRRAY